VQSTKTITKATRDATPIMSMKGQWIVHVTDKRPMGSHDIDMNGRSSTRGQLVALLRRALQPSWVGFSHPSFHRQEVDWEGDGLRTLPTGQWEGRDEVALEIDTDRARSIEFWNEKKGRWVRKRST